MPPWRRGWLLPLASGDPRPGSNRAECPKARGMHRIASRSAPHPNEREGSWIGSCMLTLGRLCFQLVPLTRGAGLLDHCHSSEPAEEPKGLTRAFDDLQEFTLQGLHSRPS